MPITDSELAELFRRRGNQALPGMDASRETASRAAVLAMLENTLRPPITSAAPDWMSEVAAHWTSTVQAEVQADPQWPSLRAGISRLLGEFQQVAAPTWEALQKFEKQLQSMLLESGATSLHEHLVLSGTRAQPTAEQSSLADRRAVVEQFAYWLTLMGEPAVDQSQSLP